jgi:hypothetical protein
MLGDNLGLNAQRVPDPLLDLVLTLLQPVAAELRLDLLRA